MTKQPYIPLYIGDWIQDTDCLSIEAEGAWLRIIFKCWKNNGMFSAKRDVFARVCKVEQDVFASILLEWKMNDICDIIEGENEIITVLSRRIRRDKEISKKRAENGSKGGSKTQANSKAKVEQIPEYDNDIDNEDKIKKEALQQKIKDAIFSDDQFIETLRITHRDKDIETAFAECYIHHSNKPSPPQELWEWRIKLNSWLSMKRPVKEKSNGYKKGKFVA